MPTQIPFDLEYRTSLDAGDFIISGANTEAVAWIERWPNWPGMTLLLLGPPGTGKTHLANVWQQRAQGHIYNDGAALATINANAVLDNIDIWAASCQTELFHLLNRAKEQSFCLLLCASQPVDVWSLALPDLLSRIKALPLARLADPDDQLLAALFTRGLVQRGVAIRPDILDYLLPRLPRSAAAVNAFANQLDRFALGHAGKLTLSVARAFLSEGG